MVRSTISAFALGLLAAGPSVAGPLTDRGTQPPLTYPLGRPGECRGCHGDWDRSNHYEPWTTWAGSMMANAARDPLFWAALDVANDDVPDVGAWCLRCHSPRGFLAGRTEPPGGSTDGCSLDGFLDAEDNDFAGVGCQLCHRMEVNPMPPVGELPVVVQEARQLGEVDSAGPRRADGLDGHGPSEAVLVRHHQLAGIAEPDDAGFARR